MKYPWLALSIALLWIMGTYTIVTVKTSSVSMIVGACIVCTTLIAYFGFKAPK